jgi:dihydrodipicolinate synthase/N-acetylneuraminate lyase
VKAEQEGLFRHLDAICRATALAVIPYNRDNCLLALETLARLAERHENLIGFKDGHGDVEQLVAIRQAVGECVAYIGSMPTAEIFAVPYLAAGFTTYSSAVFNFIPRIAMRFYAAVRAGDRATTDDSCVASSCPISRCATAAGAMPSASSRRACASSAVPLGECALRSSISRRRKRAICARC